MTDQNDKVPVGSEHVTITRKEYDELLDDQTFLEALCAAGVDNWEGYDYALELLNEEE